MLICHCEAVNDRTIDATILAGARCTEDVSTMCGAGARCGGCIPAIAQLLVERVMDEPRRTTSAA